jgi:hypothetical protein
VNIDGEVTEMTAVVPFGKYEKIPVDALVKMDRKYAGWLVTVPKVKKDHPVVYQVLIQHLQTSDTPDHNAHQVLFLDPVYRAAFVEAAMPGFIDKPYEVLEAALKTLLTEARLDLSECWATNGSEQKLEEAERNVRVCQQRLTYLLKRSWVTTEGHVEFERKGIDVASTFWADIRYPDDIDVKDLPKPLQKISAKAICDIEIKPRMGEDFPSVFRQMKHNKSKYLFLGEYTGESATIEQVREYFETSNKYIIFKAEVDAEYRRLMGETVQEGQDDARELQYILD